MSEPRYGLEDFNSVPGYAVGQNGNAPDRDTWLPLNLADLADQPPAPPQLGGFGIVYHGKRHVFSGPQESAKTLAAYAIGIETIRAHPDREIMLIDFEMGARPARTRLRELGATNQELAHILYVEPQQKADLDHILLLVAMNPVVVIIDAAAGAYANEGLDDNHRGDVEKFTNLYVRHFHQHEIATIILDHVVKNTEVRGKYAIGSERKTGGVNVHLGFDTALPIKRGSRGIYKITTHKDRDGWHQRGRLADLHLTSDPFTHAISWEFKQPEQTEDGEFLPTYIMERVSTYLRKQDTACSKNNVEENVKGGTDYIRDALNALARLEFITETKGARAARMFTHKHTFTHHEWETDPRNTAHLATSPDLATTSPKATSDTTSPPRLSPTGESERGRASEEPQNELTSPPPKLPDDGIPF